MKIREAPRLSKTLRKPRRTTQIVFGERQRLKSALDSIRSSGMPKAQRTAESKVLKRMIARRDQELNRITPAWDRKIRRARNAQTSRRALMRLAQAVPEEDYLLARVLTEHPKAPGELLESFAGYPYAAVRENVARHPNTPPELLARLARKRGEPLWKLVGCNPSAPADLRVRLRARMQGQSG